MEGLDIDFNNRDSVLQYIKSSAEDCSKDQIDELSEKIENITGINSTTKTSWGSYNYSSIKAMFDFLNLLENYFETPDILIKFLKFNIKKVKSRKLEKNHVIAIIKNYKEHVSESIASDLDDAKIDTIHNCLQFMKDQNEDLWDSIDYIFKIMFPNAEIDNIPDAIDRSGNDILLKNNVYGFKCWWLVTNGYINYTQPVSLTKSSASDGSTSAGSASDCDASDGSDSDGDASDGSDSDCDASDGDASDGDASDGSASDGDGDGSDGSASDGDASDGHASDGDAGDVKDSKKIECIFDNYPI